MLIRDGRPDVLIVAPGDGLRRVPVHAADSDPHVFRLFCSQRKGRFAHGVCSLHGFLARPAYDERRVLNGRPRLRIHDAQRHLAHGACRSHFRFGACGQGQAAEHYGHVRQKLVAVHGACPSASDSAGRTSPCSVMTHFLSSDQALAAREPGQGLPRTQAAPESGCLLAGVRCS